MRDFKGMKRQRGRNRNGGGGGGGNKPQQHNANRAFDSNGPEGIKVRGNAQHVFEKYQQLARDAQGAGDRVLAENYLQHAEHYFRVIRAVQPMRAISDIIGRDNMTSGMDIDFEDESGAQAYAQEQAEAAASVAEPQAETEYQARGDQNQARQEPRRDDRPRDRDRRDDRPREDRPREDRPRDDRPREDRPVREDRPRDRDDRPRDRDVERRPREERDPLAVVEPRGEPPREEGPVLRSGDGDVSHAPDFLKAPAEAKPRRRRAPRTSGEEVAETSEEA